MLSQEGFNALLKTLEEPPPHVKFIFATTAVDKFPETVVSRCQRYDFKRIPIARIRAELERIAAQGGHRSSPTRRCMRSRAKGRAACATRSRCSSR